MKRLIAAVLAIAPLGVFAQCFGPANMQTCTDNSGNTYNIQRFGNQTMMQGYNPSTGSNWNQNSTTIGNTTFHNGTAADGGSWNGTSTRIGNSTFYNGTNSKGQPYSATCNQFGCY